MKEIEKVLKTFQWVAVLYDNL